MFKKLVFSLLFFTAILQSQTSVIGTIDPVQEDYEWVILYQLKGAKQLYVSNATIVNGVFKVDFPTDATKGMYRLSYDLQHEGFIDFLYNNESVELKFDPKFPLGKVEFLTSEENKLYNNYLLKSNEIRNELDSLQLSFFNAEDEIRKGIISEFYSQNQKKYLNIQTEFDVKTEGFLANHFIKSSQKYYASEIIKTPQEYLNSEKSHYFDFINFEDAVLENSLFFTEKIIDYIFYLSTSDDVDVQNKLYQSSINDVVNKIGTNNYLKGELLTTLMYNFAQQENTSLVNYLMVNFYEKLPEVFKSDDIINEIQDKLKLAIGKTAPNFSWNSEEKKLNLWELHNAETYVVVFWSTSCSHCLNEIPQFYDYIKGDKLVHVIAVSLENDANNFNNYSQKFSEWTNVLGLEKWQNSIAKDYNIIATPSYFVLDANKKIISKPDFFKDVKAFFEN